MIQVSPKRGCLVMTLDPWNPKQLIEFRVPRFSYPHQVKEKHSITPVIGGLDVEGQRVKWRGEATPGHDWLPTEHGIIVTRPDAERNGFSAKLGDIMWLRVEQGSAKAPRTAASKLKSGE